jgi:glycosyltransferase involved in cell wall biosynthesis
VRTAVVFDCFFPISTGGGERLYRIFAEEFARSGHEVDYLTRQQWTGAPPQVPGVAVVAVNGPGSLYDGDGNRRPLPAVQFALGLFWHLLRRRHHYDAVLVSALPVLNVFAARAALLGSGTRMCSDYLEVWGREQWLEYSGPVVGRVAAMLQRSSVRISPMTSCHSRLHARRLVAEGARSAPITSPGLIYQSAPGPATLETAEPPTVVFVGRHIPDKQVECIPAAVLRARELLPDLRAVILGDGEQRAAVRAEIDRLGLSEVIDLPGFVNQDVLDGYLRSAACLVNPSRREGYGLVVVEACAVGTPVVLVAALDNAAVELIDEGVNGFVAASTAPEVLGAALVKAVEGGRALRESTRAWFETASVERTAAAAAAGILERLASPR